MGIMAPNGATIIPSISSISGSESASGSRTTKSGGTTEGGGVRASTSTRGPLPIFYPIVDFFHELWWNS
jgi:hypothetical protein